jgi:hypothetical protein
MRFSPVSQSRLRLFWRLKHKPMKTVVAALALTAFILGPLPTQAGQKPEPLSFTSTAQVTLSNAPGDLERLYFIITGQSTGRDQSRLAGDGFFNSHPCYPGHPWSRPWHFWTTDHPLHALTAGVGHRSSRPKNTRKIASKGPWRDGICSYSRRRTILSWSDPAYYPISGSALRTQAVIQPERRLRYRCHC